MVPSVSSAVRTLAILSAALGCALQSSAARAQTTAPADGRVRLVKTDDGWQLLRDELPYFIKGAGGSGPKPLLAQWGANSFRTWGVDDLGAQLDEAQKLGLSVAVGIWLRHEEGGFSYDHPQQVAEQLEKARQAILRYKDHPAVLLWGIGNETEGFKAGDNPAIWKAINDIAAIAKQLDPQHPTMTVIAEIGGARVKMINQLCPDIDIVGINSYGGARTVGERYKKLGGIKPYILTEFGPPGTWETGKTPWGAPVEATSTRKAEMYRQAYLGAVAGEKGLCLGSYAFTWGYKSAATVTWYGLLLPDDAVLGPVETLSDLWRGTTTPGKCPAIVAAPKLEPGDRVAPGEQLHATAAVNEPAGEAMDVKWVVRPELKRNVVDTGKPVPLAEAPNAVTASTDHDATIIAPAAPGTYRLYVYAEDRHGHAAVANVPFQVQPTATTAP